MKPEEMILKYSKIYSQGRISGYKEGLEYGSKIGIDVACKDITKKFKEYEYLQIIIAFIFCTLGILLGVTIGLFIL